MVLQEHFSHSKVSAVVKDIVGGVSGWAKTVDHTFPEY